MTKQTDTAKDAVQNAADSAHENAQMTAGTVKDAAKTAAESTKSAAQSAADTAREAAHTTVDTAKEAARTTAVTTREAARVAADRAREAGRTTVDTAHRLKEWDQQRPDFPGEHLVVAGVGLALFLMAGKSSSPLKKLLLTAAGTAALTRAASGRGGVAKVAGWFVGK